MSRKSFAKLLSPNDVGTTGSHQAGILVPKSDPLLLKFFPHLNGDELNPDAWIVCVDKGGEEWKLRYIYYNNRLHPGGGTRNEYRLTHLTAYLRKESAKPGDLLVFTATADPREYRIALDRAGSVQRGADPGVVLLRGWRQVH